MHEDPHFDEFSDPHANGSRLKAPVRVFSGAATPIPAVQLLSNGRYHAMITNAGGGYSRWKDIAVTRWREDATRDNWGTFCYLRDVANGAFWSTTFQPTLNPSAAYQADFSGTCAAFRCFEQGIDAHTEIAVSPENDIEVRRIGITNRSGACKVIDLTSYAEVVLALAAADAAHPAFSNLFVQTEIIPEQQAILCNRRSGAADHAALWMFHRMVPDESVLGDMSYETDRMRFIGRGNTLVNPQAMRDVAALSGSAGSVLDPIVAIQCRITLDPEQSAAVAIVSGIGETRDACLTLIEKYQDRHLTDRVFDLAATHSQSVLRQLNVTRADAQLYDRLADSIIYANASLRADPGILIKNRRGQSGLWGHSISGDLPIVLLQIGERTRQSIIRHHRLGKRLRQHMERERARVSPHAMVERPRRRFRRRSFLPPGRRKWTLLVACALARPRARILRLPARIRLQCVHPYGGWHRLRTVGLCGAGCSGQVRGVEGEQQVRPVAPPLRHRIYRMGAGRTAAEIDDACDHGDGSRHRSAVGT